MIYQFGQFQLDTKRREITTLGLPITVQPRVYQLILLLVSHHDQALDKNLIQETIWPSQILSETSLSRLVMKARKALKDSSEKPKYIKTVHGFGFQFIANVTQLDSKSENQNKDSVSTQTKSKQVPPTKSYFFVKFVAAVTIIFIALSFIISSLIPNDISPNKILILPVVNDTKDKMHDWVSLGIPSLVNTLLEQSKSSKVTDLKLLLNTDFRTEQYLTIKNSQIVSLKEDFSASKIVYSRLEKQGDLFILNYSVHETTTQVPTYKLSASDPSQFAKLLAEKLVDSDISSVEEVASYTISENNFVNTLYAKGQSLLLQGHTQKARDMFKVAIDEEPELFWPRYSFALTSRKLGQWAHSEKELLTLLQHPKLSLIHRAESRTRNVLGFVYYRMKQYDNALHEFEKAYELSEVLEDHRLQSGIADNVGAIYWIQYQFDEARVWLTRALSKRIDAKIKPTGHAYNLLGLLERDQGNLLAAQQNFLTSSKLFGEAGMTRDFTMAQINLSTIDEHLGQYQAALSRLNKSNENFEKIKEKEGLDFLNRQFASIYLAMNNTLIAEQYAKKALTQAEQLNSQSRIAQARFLLGRTYLAQNELDKAREYLEPIVEFHEEVWAPYVPLMKLATATKNIDGLIHYYSMATKDAKDKGDLLSHLHAESVYQSALPIFSKSTKQLESSKADIRSQARRLNAKKILAEYLIELVEQQLNNSQLDSASNQFQQLELLQPQWQIVQSLKLLLAHIKRPSSSQLKAMQKIKLSNPQFWSLREQRWLTRMQSL